MTVLTWISSPQWLPTAPTWLTVATFSLGLTIMLLFSRKRRLKRTFSFTSEGMFLGCFPPYAKVPETIINAAILFDECPSPESVIEQAVKPMLAYKRLSEIPNLDGSTRKPFHPVDASQLVRKITISGSDQVTFDTISKYFHEPLSQNRNDLPWFEFLLVDNNVGCSACVLRIHHGLADGVSLVHVFEQIITYDDGSPVTSLISQALDRKPKAVATNFWRTAWSLVSAALQVLTLGTTPFDDDTAFSRSIHGNMVHSQKRTYVIFPTIDLEFVKRLKNAAGVTVNDILMTAVSQAIHDYCLNQNCPIVSSKSSSISIQCRALLPVAFPRSKDELADTDRALRNKWCLVSTDMGVGYHDILERLRYIHSKTQEMKNSSRAFMQLLIQNSLPPLLPYAVSQKTVYDVFCRHSLVFSNVPGPERPCIFAGKKATGVQMFYSNLIPQIGLLSYGGMIYGNMVLDPDAIPDSELVGQYYSHALLELANRLNVPVPPTETTKNS